MHERGGSRLRAGERLVLVEAVAQTGPRTGASIGRGTTHAASALTTASVGFAHLTGPESLVSSHGCACHHFVGVGATASVPCGCLSSPGADDRVRGRSGSRRDCHSATNASAATMLGLEPPWRIARVALYTGEGQIGVAEARRASGGLRGSLGAPEPTGVQRFSSLDPGFGSTGSAFKRGFAEHSARCVRGPSRSSRSAERRSSCWASPPSPSCSPALLVADPPVGLVREHVLPLRAGDVAPGDPAGEALQRRAVERPFDGAHELAHDQPAVGLERH
jgi:hypothetical protein